MREDLIKSKTISQPNPASVKLNLDFLGSESTSSVELTLSCRRNFLESDKNAAVVICSCCTLLKRYISFPLRRWVNYFYHNTLQDL